LQNDSFERGGVVFAGTRGWRVPERRQTQTEEDAKIYNREVIRFELALKDAVLKTPAASGTPFTKGGLPIVAVLHYPPFNATLDDSPFTALCEKYGVTACVYGHLHGKAGRVQPIVEKNGIKYYLTSCDLVDYHVVAIDV